MTPNAQAVRFHRLARKKLLAASPELAPELDRLDTTLTYGVGFYRIAKIKKSNRRKRK